MPNYNRAKYSCYFSYVATAPAFSLPALLFMTFHDMYGISYTLLGTLVVVNFCTQLAIDLIFTFFTKYFNIHKTLRFTPIITMTGFLVYALVPTFFPQIAYLGLVLGTMIFSISAGLNEVLISPTVAAIPSEHPERDMSMLHSLYAWGVLGVILVSTLFFTIFGAQNWMFLTLFYALLPVISCIMFCTSTLPEMNLVPDKETSAGRTKSRTFGMTLCVAAIFLGSAAENTMTNWVSSYLETALQIPKAAGDIFGMAVFALLLGFARTLYAKYGKNIWNVLLVSMIGAVACYLTVSLCSNAIISLIACVFTGFCTSMLWPGMLILMEEKFPNPGVAAYALMAAGGDFGASVAPQTLGIVVDKVSMSAWAAELGSTLALAPEQIGMKVGMLVAAIFPILGIGVLFYIKYYFKKKTV